MITSKEFRILFGLCFCIDIDETTRKAERVTEPAKLNPMKALGWLKRWMLPAGVEVVRIADVRFQKIKMMNVE